MGLLDTGYISKIYFDSSPSKPLKQRDLFTSPTKSLDLRRIEAQGLDLHRHRSVFHLPLIWLRAPLSRVSCNPSSYIFVITLCDNLFPLCYNSSGASKCCGVVPRGFVRGSGIRREGFRIVECELSFCGDTHRRIG